LPLARRRWDADADADDDDDDDDDDEPPPEPDHTRPSLLARRTSTSLHVEEGERGRRYDAAM
jgi:hypothetical protein